MAGALTHLHTMGRAKAPPTVNSNVTRAEAENLQCLLFQAAAQALQQALREGTIQASLLSSCHQILKDSGLQIDLSGDDDAEDAGPSPNWLLALQSDLGL